MKKRTTTTYEFNLGELLRGALPAEALQDDVEVTEAKVVTDGYNDVTRLHARAVVQITVVEGDALTARASRVRRDRAKPYRPTGAGPSGEP